MFSPICLAEENCKDNVSHAIHPLQQDSSKLHQSNLDEKSLRHMRQRYPLMIFLDFEFLITCQKRQVKWLRVNVWWVVRCTVRLHWQQHEVFQNDEAVHGSRKKREPSCTYCKRNSQVQCTRSTVFVAATSYVLSYRGLSELIVLL